jgi:hypothetical protein
MGAEHSPLDFRFHFFPWWRCPDYGLKPTGTAMPENYTRYFVKLAETAGIELSAEQQAWYAAKAETQLADMRREYPSTAEEAFESSVEGAYFAEQLARAETEGRIGDFPAIADVPVNTSWDLGIGDATAIWFWQMLPNQRRRLVGYLEASGEAMPWFIAEMRRLATERSWTLGEHFLPHDSKTREWTSGRTRFEQFAEAMKRFPRLTPDESVDDGINAARLVLNRCEFDEAACAEGLKALRNYRKEWNEEAGCWRDKPRHDWASPRCRCLQVFRPGYS